MNGKSSERIRVLVLTSTFPRWAGDKEPPFVFELSRRLGQRFDVLALAPHAPGAQLAEELAGIHVRRFRYAPTGLESLAYNGGILANLRSARWRFLLVPGFILAQFFALMQILRRTRVDVIHAHWLLPQGMVAVLARMLWFWKKTTVICTSHGSDLFGLKGKLVSRLQKFVLRRSDQVTVVSKALSVLSCTLSGRNDTVVLPMGVDLSNRFVPDDNVVRSDCELLFVGRLVEEKGAFHALEAFAEVLATHPQTRFLIVGEGPERAALEKMAQNLGLDRRVEFLGAVDNARLPELYRHAAILVGPSLREGLGLVFVEALGCECPVVAFDLPSIRDVLVDETTGCLAEFGNSHDLAIKIGALLDDSARRQAMGRAGRKHVVQRYSWDIVAERYGELLCTHCRVGQ